MNEITKTANLSQDDGGKYRYRLTRIWDVKNARRVVFVMLNPSTADADVDDPTIRKCMGFARLWGQQKWIQQIGGFGGISVVNLFALRATDPAQLLKDRSPFGPDNDDYIRREVFAASAAGSIVVCAWGANKAAEIIDDPISCSRRCDHVAHMIRRHGDRINTFRIGPTTKAGHPPHPLYLPYEMPLENFFEK